MTRSRSGRPKLLWVWRDQPSRLGAGSQQRAAHVLLGLAGHFDLHVVIAPTGPGMGAIGDADLFARFASFEEVRETDPLTGPALDVPARIAAAALRHGTVATLITTFELAVFLRPVLDALQPAYLELDELMSRRQQRFLATPGLSADKAAEFRRGLRLLSMLERQMLPEFRGVIVSSPLETEHLRGRVAEGAVSFVPNATHRETALPPPPSGPARTIMFVGRMDYFPNVDGARFFLAEVWPLLRSRYGDGVRCHIVGARAPASFNPEATAGVVFDRSRADIVPVYEGASVAVVPIRAGGGTRVKILEAFALGRPVVATTMGAEGLDVEDGRHLLIADDPEAFAAACGRLMDDPALAARLVAEASAWVQKHHSTAAVAAAVRESILVRDVPGTA